MGDPKKPKKKYSAPSHPWQSDRLEEEAVLVKEYGFKNKREIYKMRSILTSAADQAKKLIAATGAQAEKEEKQLIARLHKLGLIPVNGNIDNILSLTIKDICERRLQTFVHKKGFARSTKQARQFITHGHIMVGDKIMSVPSYIVPIAEEPEIKFMSVSSLNDPNHPERIILESKPKPESSKRRAPERRDGRGRMGQRQGRQKTKRRMN